MIGPSPETQIMNEYQHYVDLAKTAPKIELGQKVAGKDHVQFGNNFFLLFKGMREISLNPRMAEADQLAKIYIIKTARINNWDAFLKNNEELINEIYNALDGLAPYEDLGAYVLKLCRIGKIEEAEKLGEQVGHPLEFEAIGIYAWNKLNPLLEKIYKLMKEEGINAEKLSWG